MSNNIDKETLFVGRCLLFFPYFNNIRTTVCKVNCLSSTKPIWFFSFQFERCSFQINVFFIVFLHNSKLVIQCPIRRISYQTKNVHKCSQITDGNRPLIMSVFVRTILLTESPVLTA